MSRRARLAPKALLASLSPSPGSRAKDERMPGFSSPLGSCEIKREVASTHSCHLLRYDFEGVGRPLLPGPKSWQYQSLFLSKTSQLTMLFVYMDSFYLHHHPSG